MIKLKQLEEYRFEHKMWLKKLEVLLLEIILYRKRVTDIIIKEPDRIILEQIKYFYTYFQRKYEKITVLKINIKQQEHTLSDINITNSENLSKYVIQKEEKMRDDIVKLEKVLILIEAKFDEYHKKIYGIRS